MIKLIREEIIPCPTMTFEVFKKSDESLSSKMIVACTGINPTVNQPKMILIRYCKEYRWFSFYGMKKCSTSDHSFINSYDAIEWMLNDRRYSVFLCDGPKELAKFLLNGGME